MGRVHDGAVQLQYEVAGQAGRHARDGGDRRSIDRSTTHQERQRQDQRTRRASEAEALETGDREAQALPRRAAHVIVHGDQRDDERDEQTRPQQEPARGDARRRQVQRAQQAPRRHGRQRAEQPEHGRHADHGVTGQLEAGRSHPDSHAQQHHRRDDDRDPLTCRASAQLRPDARLGVEQLVHVLAQRVQIGLGDLAVTGETLERFHVALQLGGDLETFCVHGHRSTSFIPYARPRQRLRAGSPCEAPCTRGGRALSRR